MPKVYTRKGDDGTTGLLYGGRLPKSDARVAAYGDCDEVVAALGLARAQALSQDDPEIAELVLRFQGEMFVVGAELATAPKNWPKLTDGVTRVTTDMTSRLEADIDRLEASYEQPKDFIVPGNTALGAHLDHAGRVVRRAERSIVALSRRGKVRPEVLAYVNRLADAVWVLARFAERGQRQPRHREARKA